MDSSQSSVTPHTGAKDEINDDGSLSPPKSREAHTPPPHKQHLSNLPMEPGNESVDTGVHDLSARSKSQNAFASSDTMKTDILFTNAGESLAEWLRRGIVDHQLGLSMNLILLVCLSWLLFPSLRERMEAFSSLSYPGTYGMYGQGPKDLQLVLSFVVIFTALRAFALDYVLIPLASLLGIRRQKPKVRFAEQSYLLLYYCIYWSWGLHIFIKDTPASLRGAPLSLENLLVSLWTGFPRLELDSATKLYYLSQLAFWIQQILVIHLEEKRKDHYQMLTHHFVTVALMSTSYGYRQCRVGTAVLICMDIVDLIFPLAKILRYLGLQTACDIAFALFVVTWLAARHAAYLTICWSIYAHVNTRDMFYGTYSLLRGTQDGYASGLQLSTDGGHNAFSNIFQPFVNPTAETVSFNAHIQWGFLGLLLGLQCITLMWFVMICRVVARVLRGEGADDSRSDDEGEGEHDVEDGPSAVQPSTPYTAAEPQKFIEVESTAEELTFGNGKRHVSERSGKRKSKGFSSSLNLGERKEILNRIGCLSEEQLAREREKREGTDASRSGGGSSR